MKTTLFSIATNALVAGVLTATAACTPSAKTASDNETGSTISAAEQRSAPGPRPNDPTTEIAQLQRYRGQTSFLTYDGYDRCPECQEEQPKQDQPKQDQSQGGERAEQESDVFKIGPEGSKLVYLLNNYRGLQVVSFADGIEQPKIVGRSPATGRMPQNMYRYEDRIFAIEHAWIGNEEKSRIVVYDVKDSAKPERVQTVEVDGSVSDSRIVGSVLYVAVRSENTGRAISYDLRSSRLREVDRQDLSMRVSREENMNIQHVEKNGQHHYYLIATLSEGGWGWNTSSSVIEVIDISDARGKIRPLMSVAARGTVRERSQTTIKNDTLIVTSNYRVDENTPLRIAVETFRFPTRDSETLSEKEAQFRRLRIERELRGKTGKAREELYERLVNDPEFGLRGRFIATSGSPRKLVTDSGVTVGDGAGLHANLRDVRYQDGLLYAFWVPQNEIDPFDLFDISKPEEGIRYLGRLHFDGWIERAIPFEHAGRKFVLGLGWIVPVEEESGRRQPQAMIFEVREQDGRLRAVDVAQYSFVGSNIWTNFSGQDKMVEVRLGENGAGEVLFAADKEENGKYIRGGQVLRFDLQAIVDGRNREALKQSVFLNGGSSWLRRVFTNPEIDRINTFSDRELSTFGARLPNDEGTLHPVSVLELARDIRAFATVREGETLHGVQIIQSSSWYDGVTTFRQVSLERADAEKSEARAELTVPGAFIDRMEIDGDLYVLTSRYVHDRTRDGSYSYRSILSVARLGIVGGVLQLKSRVEWTNQRSSDPATKRVTNGEGFVRLADGSLLAQADSNLRRIEIGSELSARPIAYEGCKVDGRENVIVKRLSDKYAFIADEIVTSRDHEGLTFKRRFFAPITFAGDKATCARELNIPGDPILFTASGTLVTQDTWVTDIRKEDPLPAHSLQDEPPDKPDHDDHFKVLTKSSSLALKLGESAELRDEKAQTYTPHGTIDYGDSTIVRIEGNDYQRALVFYGVDQLSMFTEERFVLPAEFESPVFFTIVPHPRKPGESIALLHEKGEMAAISWSTQDRRPKSVRLASVNHRFEKGPFRERVSLANGPSYSNDAHFTPAQMSFEISQGLMGISRIFIEP